MSLEWTCQVRSGSFLIDLVKSVPKLAQSFVSELRHAMVGGLANIAPSAHRTVTQSPCMLQANPPPTRSDEAGQFR